LHHQNNELKTPVYTPKLGRFFCTLFCSDLSTSLASFLFSAALSTLLALAPLLQAVFQLWAFLVKSGPHRVFLNHTT
jgi:hypothetical protein